VGLLSKHTAAIRDILYPVFASLRAASRACYGLRRALSRKRRMCATVVLLLLTMAKVRDQASQQRSATVMLLLLLVRRPSQWLEVPCDSLATTNVA
jgi:hypothetical protein